MDYNSWQDLGLSGLANEFDKGEKYGGAYEDDLGKIIRRFKTLTKIFNVKDNERLKAIPIMLNGDTLDFFDEYHDTCSDYQEAIEKLRKWYLSP